MDPDRPIVRWTLIVLWVLVGMTLWMPPLALVSWPSLLAMFIAAIIWTAQDFRTLQHQFEALAARSHRWFVRVELGVLAGVSGASVAFATAVSMQSPHHTGQLSSQFAPVLLAVILVATLAAARRPSPRRLAIVSLVSLASYPLLASVRILAIPLTSSETFRVTQPLVHLGYVVSVMALGALGVHLGIVARRQGYGDEILPPPPRAQLRS